MLAIEQRQPISQKNLVGFDKRRVKKFRNDSLNQRKYILERRMQIASFSLFKKAVKASIKELKDQNKNEKYLDNEGKNVLQ